LHELSVVDELSPVLLTVLRAEAVDIIALFDMFDNGERGKAKIFIALVSHQLHILRHPPDKLILIMFFTDHSLKQTFPTSSLVARKRPQTKEIHSDQDVHGVINDVHISS
jgi:hypothetical protein